MVGWVLRNVLLAEAGKNSGCEPGARGVESFSGIVVGSERREYALDPVGKLFGSGVQLASSLVMVGFGPSSHGELETGALETVLTVGRGAPNLGDPGADLGKLFVQGRKRRSALRFMRLQSRQLCLQDGDFSHECRLVHTEDCVGARLQASNQPYKCPADEDEPPDLDEQKPKQQAMLSRP